MNDWMFTQQFRDLAEPLKPIVEDFVDNINPTMEKIQKHMGENPIIDIEEDEIEPVESDCTDLVEQEVVECETEEIGTNKKTRNDAFDAIRYAAEFMKYSPYGYNFTKNAMKDN